uniref:Uncharacterized protein n=1 Tax=Setaria italica TaxID=4555 RepID=K3YWR8_SETIT
MDCCLVRVSATLAIHLRVPAVKLRRRRRWRRLMVPGRLTPAAGAHDPSCCDATTGAWSGRELELDDLAARAHVPSCRLSLLSSFRVAHAETGYDITSLARAITCQNSQLLQRPIYGVRVSGH